jgi:hypothetical protein
LEDDGPRLVYNPEDGSVELRAGGPAITVEGIADELLFERMTADGNSAVPLWLEADEVVVLGKMIRYIVERVKITESSRETLQRLLPRVEEMSARAPAAPSGE